MDDPYCEAVTKIGNRCHNHRYVGYNYCRNHLRMPIHKINKVNASNAELLMQRLQFIDIRDNVNRIRTNNLNYMTKNYNQEPPQYEDNAWDDSDEVISKMLQLSTIESQPISEEINSEINKAMKLSLSESVDTMDIICELFDWDPDKLSKIKCICCYDERIVSDIIACTNISKNCQHYVCTDCIKNNIIICIREVRINLKCISCDNCDGEYKLNDIKKCLTDVESIEFEKVMNIVNVSKKALEHDNYQICPFCKQYGQIIDERCKSCICRNCSKVWCVLCRKDFHDSDPCYKITDSNNIEEIDKIINEAYSDVFSHTCPKCKIKYTKDGGCNLMTCETCGTHSCYVCKKVVVEKINNDGNKITHYHFIGSGSSEINAKCLLYSDTDGKSDDQGTGKQNVVKLCEKINMIISVNSDEVINKILIGLLQRDLVNEVYKLVGNDYKTILGNIFIEMTRRKLLHSDVNSESQSSWDLIYDDEHNSNIDNNHNNNNQNNNNQNNYNQNNYNHNNYNHNNNQNNNNHNNNNQRQVTKLSFFDKIRIGFKKLFIKN